MGKVNVVIIEVCEVILDGKIYLMVVGGIVLIVCCLVDQIIVELNSVYSKNMMGMYDVYELFDLFYCCEILIYKLSDCIGLFYIQVDLKKIVGIVEINWFDEVCLFVVVDFIIDKIGQNVVDFLVVDMKCGIIFFIFFLL